jgi:hypothetical protein
MKKITPILLFVFLGSAFFGAMLFAQEQGHNIVLKWAFIHRSPAGDKEVINFSGRPLHNVTSKDELQIYFQPLTELYLYLFLYDTHRDLYPLFPDSADYYRKNGLLEGEEYYLPSKYDWFAWDGSKGRETFYLLVSTKRLSKLEGLIKRYLDSNGDSRLQAELYKEVRKIQKEKSKLSTVSEKPVAIAGTIRTRGLDSDISGDAIMVEAKDFYGKTLRLNHE